MYYNEPVLIPEIQGRVFMRNKGDSVYVLFQISRTYDPETKNNRSERCIIGIQIPRKPEYMLPNENYYKYFVTKEAAERNEKQATQDFARKMAQWEKLRDDFDHMYYDFQTVSRGRWNEVVSPDSVTMINEILAPVIEMLKEDEEDWTRERVPGPGEGVRTVEQQTEENDRAGKQGPRKGGQAEKSGPGEGNGARLALIPDPVEHDAGGVKGYDGKTFEYVNFLLGQFKGAIGRFFQKGSR